MKKLIAVLITAAFAGAALNAAAQAPKATPATPAQAATPAQPAKAKADNGKKKSKGKGRARPERRDSPAFLLLWHFHPASRTGYNRGPDHGLAQRLNSPIAAPPWR